MYNWQFKNWPNFIYSVEKLQKISVAFAQEFGLVNGLLTGLNNELKQETILEILIEEAIKTSEIEGEFMSREDVMSSIKNNLGLQQNPEVKDKRASGVAKLMVEVNQKTVIPLTTDLICYWHQLLMEHNQKVNPGFWRNGEAQMQIISGAYGREVVHFEAPPSAIIAIEMERFINWYNNPELPVKDNISKALLKSAIVHLHFESIHPFEDGNGRIGRALAEFALSQTLNAPVLLSLSKTIENNKKLYYDQLKSAQRSLDIAEWVEYFSEIILEAQKDSKALIEFTLKKAMFFDKFKEQLNDRQLKVINRMLEEGAAGFIGGMTAKKYMAISKTSKATATRDMQQLNELGVFVLEGAGRSVRYQMVL
jgi:Fic family protein